MANERVVVAQTTASAACSWATILGKQLTAATGTVADTDLLEVINAGVTLICDGTSGSTAWSAGTCAGALGATNVSVYMFGRQSDVAAT